MNDPVAQFFRRLTLVCLLGVGAIATLTYTDFIPAKAATLAIAILAMLLFVFDVLADEPEDLSKVEAGMSRLLAIKALSSETNKLTDTTEPLSADQTQLVELVKANPQLLDLINASSDQLYLLKLRSYLINQIQSKYEGSGIATYVWELKQVEAELELLELDYDPLEIPERFRELINSFDRQKRVETYASLIDALPFIPFKGAIKLYLRLRFR